MEGLEEKLGSVLNNPEMMQKIMTMAQSLGAAQAPASPPESTPAAAPMPEFDMSILQKVSGLARQGTVDREQQALLNALSPYLSKERIRKLENAMRAARMAKIAAAALSQGGLNPPAGR